MGCFNSNTTEGGKSDTDDMAAALPKLTAKLNELIARRDSQTPRVIAKGNYCSNPCYEFNLNLVNECPKCKGKVIMEYENEYTIKKDYNREGREIEKKIYNKNACDKFEFDQSLISPEDYKFGVLCAYFELDEKEGETTKHYMMLDGERIDLGTNGVMNVLYKYQKQLLPEKNGVELLLSFAQLGKPTILLYNQGGFERMPLVCLYTCAKCGHKYHIMQTSPFMYRDKSKDVVGEKYKQVFPGK